MAQNIFDDVVSIDTKFAQIIARVYQNKYNPSQIYDIRRSKNNPNQQFDKQVSFKNNQAANDMTDTIYSGQYNPKNYTRYIKTDLLQTTLSNIKSQYDRLLNKNNTSKYNSNPTSSPYKQDFNNYQKQPDLNDKSKSNIYKNQSDYNPISLPSNPRQLARFMGRFAKIANNRDGLLKGLGGLGQGLGQFYFGGITRIGRTVGQSGQTYNWNLASFVIQNTFAGLFLNMTPTPMSFALGFDIPLIGPLSINTVGAFGKGGFKSQYKQPLSIQGQKQLHTFSAPGQQLPVTQRSGLIVLQQGLLQTQKIDSDGKGTDPNNFYDLVNTARQTNRVLAGAGKSWKKRQISSIGQNLNLNKLLSKLVNKNTTQPNKNKNLYTMKKSYKKIVTNDGQLIDFYSQIGITSPNVILIKIYHQKPYGSIQKELIIPATITNLSDGVNASWQDVFNNTGRFQPIKVYNNTTRSMQLGFKVFSYTLFNDVDIRKDIKLATKQAINYSRNKIKSGESSSISDTIKSKDKKYRQTINWLTNLCYPTVQEDGFKRYNNITKLTIGQYIKQQNVIVNSVSVTPSNQFYWSYKFPMVVDISMSVNIYRQTDNNGKPQGFPNVLQESTKSYSVPGGPITKLIQQNMGQSQLDTNAGNVGNNL